MNNGFAAHANNKNAYHFSSVVKDKIIKILSEDVGLSIEEQQRYIGYIETMGILSGFGCGSLLTYSHLEKVPPGKDGERVWKDSLLNKFPNINLDKLYNIMPANLKGYADDFVCQDIFYRGTSENPGITIGIDKVEGGVTKGGVLVTDLTTLDLKEEQFQDFIVYYLEEFINREFPPNMPIYKFKFKDIHMLDGSIMPALACMADQSGPLYVGHLSLKERAYILATSKGLKIDPKTGEEKEIGMITNLDYMRNIIDSKIDKDIVVDDRFIDLYTAAVAMRSDIDLVHLNDLESYEQEGAHSGVIQYYEPTDLNNAGKLAVRWALGVHASSTIELNPL